MIKIENKFGALAFNTNLRVECVFEFMASLAEKMGDDAIDAIEGYVQMLYPEFKPYPTKDRAMNMINDARRRGLWLHGVHSDAWCTPSEAEEFIGGATHDQVVAWVSSTVLASDDDFRAEIGETLKAKAKEVSSLKEQAAHREREYMEEESRMRERINQRKTEMGHEGHEKVEAIADAIMGQGAAELLNSVLIERLLR